MFFILKPMSPQDTGREVVRKENPGIASVRVVRLHIANTFYQCRKENVKKKIFFTKRV
jgi:hypothetical protein